MVTEPRFQLTTRDHAVLQALLDDHDGPHGPYSLLLEQKLRACAIAFSDDIGADVVRLGVRVAYTVNGQPAGPHRLVQDDAHDLPHDMVSIRTMRGLALIGLRDGAAITVDLGNGGVEELVVGKVLPESEAGGSTVVSFRPRKATAPVPGPEDDDPGPRAA
jgi:regulator of nucleoside diphosphate kinase